MSDSLIKELKAILKNNEIENIEDINEICSVFDKKIQELKDKNLEIENNPELTDKAILTLDRLFYFVNGIPYDDKKDT